MPTKTKKQLEGEVSMLNDALEAALSLSPERDNNFFTGGLSPLYESRNAWDRKKIFAEGLRAWRVNPIARRITKLMTSFVLGKGIALKCDDETTQTFLQEWFTKNKLKRNLKRWKDEDTRTGNLFILFNVLENGMTILRAVPAEQIEEIKTVENDIETETGYMWKDSNGIDEKTYPAYDKDAEQDLFMLHFASNQPVGSPWGEADLSPLLVWIGRFSSWLENRARLNQFRTAFMYVVSGQYTSEVERSAREKTLNANPPKSGSVLVMNSKNGEQWGILSAQLDSFDATLDGTALKKMILDGIGQPMHWHAEPEGATQTTAEAAGTPTFRTLEETQDDFFEMIIECANTAREVRSHKVKGMNLKETIKVEGPDITERDNATLALALGRAYPHLSDLFDRDGIDAKEFLRLVYKTFAEVWDEKKVPKIKKKPLVKPPSGVPTSPQDPLTDPTDPQEGN